MRKIICSLFLVGCSQGEQPTPPKDDAKTTAQPVPPVTKPPATVAAVVEPPSTKRATTAPTDSEESYEDDVKPAPVPKSETLVDLPAASLPLKAFAMSGPYKTYDEYCKAAARTLDSWIAKNQESLEMYADTTAKTALDDVCPTTKRKKKSAEDYEYESYYNELLHDEKLTSGPYMQLKMSHHQNMFDMVGRASVELAVQTKDGWFGVQLISYAPSWMGAGGAVQRERSVKEMKVYDAIPGGEPEIVFTINGYDDKGGRMADEGFKSKDLLFVCGMGASGRPSCYAPIRIAESEETNIYGEYNEETDDMKLKKKIVTGWRMKAPYFKDGQLVLAPEEEKEEIPRRIKDLFGSHALSFP